MLTMWLMVNWLCSGTVLSVLGHTVSIWPLQERGGLETEYLRCWPPVKRLEPRSKQASLVAVLHTWFTQHWWEMSAVQTTSLREDSGTFPPGFCWTPLHAPFPFPDFNLYLFSEINLSISITAFLSSVSPANKSSNQRWSQWSLTQMKTHLPCKY